MQGIPQPGARKRARERAEALRVRSRADAGVSVGAEQRDPSDPETWRQAWDAAERSGDPQALQAKRVPSLDHLCGPGGRMYCQGGVCYCRFDGEE